MLIRVMIPPGISAGWVGFSVMTWHKPRSAQVNFQTSAPESLSHFYSLRFDIITKKNPNPTAKNIMILFFIKTLFLYYVFQLCAGLWFPKCLKSASEGALWHDGNKKVSDTIEKHENMRIAGHLQIIQTLEQYFCMSRLCFQYFIQRYFIVELTSSVASAIFPKFPIYSVYYLATQISMWENNHPKRIHPYDWAGSFLHV